MCLCVRSQSLSLCVCVCVFLILLCSAAKVCPASPLSVVKSVAFSRPEDTNQTSSPSCSFSFQSVPETSRCTTHNSAVDKPQQLNYVTHGPRHGTQTLQQRHRATQPTHSQRSIRLAVIAPERILHACQPHQRKSRSHSPHLALTNTHSRAR